MLLSSSILVFLTVIKVGAAFREAKDEEFPFQVSIQSLDKRHICGGAIIAPKWVLSAISCFTSQNAVRVVYGSADSNNQERFALSETIIPEVSYNLNTKSRLALVKLNRPIEFSNTAAQAHLPLQHTKLRNTTKLSGWKSELGVSVPPSLFVADTYNVITENCRSPGGLPINLSADEFCGMDEEGNNILYNPGSIVSKRNIALGLLVNPPMAGGLPFIYVKLSEHEQWIKDTLGGDAQFVNWVDKVPKDSAPSHSAMSLALLGISAILLRLV